MRQSVIHSLPFGRTDVAEQPSQFELSVQLAQGAFGNMEKLGKLFLGLASGTFCDIAGDADCGAANLTTKAVLFFGWESIHQLVREENHVDGGFPRL